jgi:hypothetical protein
MRSRTSLLGGLTAWCTVAGAQVLPELPLWPGPGAETDPRVASVRHDGACGPVALARVTRLPPPQTRGALRSELAVELSESGATVRRWPKPVDYEVAGLRGSKILVSPYGSTTEALFVAPGGVLEVTTLPSDRPSLEPYKCPRIAAFRKSAYVRCYKVKDIGSGKVRRLAYEGPCT